MSKKFVTIEIPLVELSSDSEHSAQVPPASPAASRTPSDPRTPRRFPTVSDDDDEDPETPPGYGQQYQGSPHPPARRSPTPPPPRAAPAPMTATAARPPLVPSGPTGPRMSTGPRPTYQLAARDFPPGFPPRPMYHQGESSRQPDFNLQHSRQMDHLSGQMRDTRYHFFRLEESQRHVVERVGHFEQQVVGLRQSVDDHNHDMDARLRDTRADIARGTSILEALAVGAAVVVVIAVVIGLLPYFLGR